MKFTRMLGAFVAGTTLAVAAFGSAAGADTADDIQIIVGNAPTAIENLPDRLQAVVDTYLETLHTKETVAEAINATGFTLTDLVQGTEQFAMVPLGFGLVAITGQIALNPYLEAMDDWPRGPHEEIYVEDIATILAQLPDAADPLSDNLTIAVIEGLQGNITAGTGLNAGVGTPAAVGNVFVGSRDAVTALLAGTSLSNFGLFYTATVGVAAIATAGYVQDAEDALAPVFEALAPVTSPLVEALGG